MEHAINADELLAHGDFVRRLAHALLQDEAKAEDAVQETWLAALRHPPRRGRDPRPWLATVVRNVVRQGRRADAHRSAREEDAARPERSEADPARSLEELERQQLLLAAIAALPRQQRDALVERFLRGHDLRAAAHALGIPTETLRTRTKRALAALRTRLDEEAGGRHAWSMWLAPLTVPQPQPTHLVPTTFAGAALVNQKLLVGAAALVLAPVVFYGLRGVLVEPPKSAADKLVAEAAAPDAEQRKDTPPEAAVLPGVAPDEREALAASGPAHAEGRVTLLVYGLRPDGSRLAGLDGELELATPESVAQQIPIEGGRGTIDQESLHALAAREPGADQAEMGSWSLALGGRPAMLDEASRERLAQAEAGEIELFATLLEPVTLRIVNRSGRDLDGVEVLRGLPKYKDDVAPRDASDLDAARIARAARSPLTFEPVRRIETYWARATGAAWGFLEVDHADGGTRELILAAAGAVEVRPDFVPPADIDVSLRAYRQPNDSPRKAVGEWQLERDGPTLIEGLPLGAWTLKAEVGWWAQPPIELGQVQAEVRAETTTVVLLTLDRTLLRESAPVRGTLVLAEADAVEAQLVLAPLGRAPLRDGDRAFAQVSDLKTRGAEHFDFDFDVTPGRYRLRLRPFEVVHDFEVPAAGVFDLELRVPQLATVDVEVVDADSGEPLALDKIAWSRTDVPLHGVMTLQDATALPGKPGLFRFRTPEGGVSLSVADAERQPLDNALLNLSVSLPATEHIVPMKRLPSFRLRLEADGATVPWSWSSRFTAQHLDGSGEGQCFVRTIDDGRATIQALEPGRYRFQVLAPDGYATPAAFEVLLDGGDVQEQVVSLRRP